MKPSLTEIKQLSHLNRDDLKWIQSRLAVGGFYKGEIDGIAGTATLKAFAEFKSSAWLNQPTLISGATIDILEQLGEPEPVSEQPGQTFTINKDAGSKTGKSVVLPKVGLKYANEWVLAGSHLTWGEVFRNFERMPENSGYGGADTIVMNALEVASVFRDIRNRIDSPLGVNSFYRPPSVNRRVGGARNSQHLYCRATDVTPLNGDFRKLYEIIKAHPRVKGIGDGLKKGRFYHFDIRPGKRVYFSY